MTAEVSGVVQRIKVLLVGLPNLLNGILTEAIESASHAVITVTEQQAAIEKLDANEDINVVIFALEANDLMNAGSKLLRKDPGLAVFSVCENSTTLIQLEFRPVVVAHGEAFLGRLIQLIEETTDKQDSDPRSWDGSTS